MLKFGRIRELAQLDAQRIRRQEKLKARQKAWGWAGKGYVQNMSIKYDMTPKMLDAMWDAQEGRCAGCQEELAHPLRKEMKMGLPLEIDHCHETGVVRGLLCCECNGLMGKLQDNADTFKNLNEHLRKFK